MSCEDRRKLLLCFITKTCLYVQLSENLQALSLELACSDETLH
jgi:hypothetical protein